MIQLTRQDSMSPRVPRQKGNFASSHFPSQNFIRWLTERRLYLHPLLLRETFDLVQTTPADDTDPTHIGGSSLETQLRQLVLQLRLELQQIFLARLISLFLRCQPQPPHLVQIPLRRFPIAELHLPAYQGSRPRDLIHRHRNTSSHQAIFLQRSRARRRSSGRRRRSRWWCRRFHWLVL